MSSPSRRSGPEIPTSWNFCAETVAPVSLEEASAVLAGAGAGGRRLRFRGGATKLGWGLPVPAPDLVVSTRGLSGVVEYNPGDLTAVVRAGTPLAELAAVLDEHGQVLALDPPGPPGAVPGAGSPTLGGVVATADSGPLRHRFGAVRDLVLGVTVVLSDGTVARAGGKVIKNVAGYDLGKLFTGSYGTLGLIAEVAVRLHPRPRGTATVIGRSDRPDRLAAAAAACASVPLAADCLDVAWSPAGGVILVRFGADDSGPRRERAAALLAAAGLDVSREEGAAGDGSGGERADRQATGRDHSDRDGSDQDRPGREGSEGERCDREPSGRDRLDRGAAGRESDGGEGVGRERGGEGSGGDEPWWEAQRAGQRSAGGTVLRVSARPADLAAVLAAARDVSAGLVGRAGLGLSWLRLPEAPAEEVAASVEALRRRLGPAPCVVLDAPEAVRAALDPWGPQPGPVALMRRVKERFDPAGVCHPGVFVDGI